MIEKLRWKFVGIMMLVVAVLLFTIFGTLYCSTRLNYSQQSLELLRSAMMENYQNGVPPRPLRQGNRTLLLVVDRRSDGSLLVQNNRFLNLTEQEVQTLVDTACEAAASSGVLKDWHMRYLNGRRGKNGMVRWVFTDISQEENALYWQIIHSAVIGAGAFGVFLLLALWLSKWAVKPVQRSWEQQKQFVADASHELKTPLTVILSNTAMLLDNAAKLDAKNIQRLNYIKEEARRMRQLVENLLTLAGNDSGEAEIVCRDCDLSYLVSSSAMAFEPVFFDLENSFDSDVEEALHVQGDEKKLRQLVDILLDNAGKYCTPGGRIELFLSHTGTREAVLTVVNDGKPLTKEELAHIFFRFYRADPARSSVAGYGLGLSIAQAIVKEHQGKIEAQSEENGKIRFTVRLPLFVS